MNKKFYILFPELNEMQIKMLKRLILEEVIGKDVELKQSGERNRLDTERNNLKAEQRARLEELIR